MTSVAVDLARWTVTGVMARPLSPAQLTAKLADCVRGLDIDLAAWTWTSAADTLRRHEPK